MTKRILLIGGAGYVGSVLSQRFLDLGWSVRCLDKFVYNNHAAAESLLGHANYQFSYDDLCDKEALSKASSGTDYVIILAGLVGDPITKKYPQESQKINVDGIQKVFSSLHGKGIQNVLFISTCSNYGLMPDGVLAKETSPLTPLSLYAKAKVAAEEKLMSMRGEVDYCPTILRFATAFGLSPRMRFDLTVSEFTRELALGNELLVFDPDTWRPYCHLQDFASLIIKVLEAERSKVEFEVFNAGGDANNFTKRMLIDVILKKLPKAKVKYKEDGGDPRNYKVDFSKVKSVLDFDPMFTVPSGVDELLYAIKQGFFRNLDNRKDHFGNYQLYNV